MLGSTIREARKAKSWSQEELAAAAKISRRHLSEIERDAVHGLSVDVLVRVARALELDELELEDLSISIGTNLDDASLFVDRFERAYVAITEARSLLKPLRQRVTSGELGESVRRKQDFLAEFFSDPGDESSKVHDSSTPQSFDIRNPPADFPLIPVERWEVEEYVDVPVWGWAAAGEGIEYIDLDETAHIPKRLQPKDGELLMRARGESMKDYDINDGDYLVVAPRIRGFPGNNEVVIAWVQTPSHDGVVIKTWYRKEGKKALLSGNQNSPDIHFDPERGDRFELRAIVRRAFRLPRPQEIPLPKTSG